MITVDKAKYLGDWITVNGNNNINIKQRENKGVGAISQVMSILKEISLGYHFFSIGLLLRETYIINSILFNSEVWYNLTKDQVNTLENIDVMYLRKLFEAHSKTSIEAFYIESGKIPIRFIIQIRRLMYWWHLNNVPQKSLIQRC